MQVVNEKSSQQCTIECFRLQFLWLHPSILPFWCRKYILAVSLSLPQCLHRCCLSQLSPYLEPSRALDWSVTLLIFTISVFISCIRSSSLFGTRHPLYLYALAKTSVFSVPPTVVFFCVDGATAIARLLIRRILGKEPTPNLHWL